MLRYNLKLICSCLIYAEMEHWVLAPMPESASVHTTKRSPGPDISTNRPHTGPLRGLWWFNSHNDDEAFALFERAGNVFTAVTDMPLSAELDEIASLIAPMRKTIDFSSI